MSNNNENNTLARNNLQDEMTQTTSGVLKRAEDVYHLAETLHRAQKSASSFFQTSPQLLALAELVAGVKRIAGSLQAVDQNNTHENAKQPTPSVKKPAWQNNTLKDAEEKNDEELKTSPGLV